MQTCDSEGLNGLHLAIVNGNWKILQYLLEELEISPNRITNSGDGLYHTIIRSINANPPTAEDWADLKEACVTKWNDVERVANEQEAVKQLEREGCTAPQSLSMSASETTLDIFGDPKMTPFKFFGTRYRVYPRTENSSGLTPEQLATSLGMTEIVQWFENHTTKEESLKRLIRYMPDSIFRELIYYL